jgi:hypothetical protein
MYMNVVALKLVNIFHLLQLVSGDVAVDDPISP